MNRHVHRKRSNDDSRRICDLLRASIEENGVDARNASIDAIKSAIREIGIPTRGRRKELLELALKAQVDGLYIDDLDEFLEGVAWERVTEATLKMKEDLTHWRAEIATITALVLLITRNFSRTGSPFASQRAVGALNEMHDAVHTHFKASGKDAPSQQVFDDLVQTATKVYCLVSAECAMTALKPLICIAQTNLLRQAGMLHAVFSRNAPLIPIESCIEEICVFLPDAHDADVYITVSRDNIIASSFESVMDVTKEEWMACDVMDVCFEGETAYGEGVVRDWIGSLASEMFYNSPYFMPCPTNPSVVHPTPLREGKDDEKWMEFAGRIIGLAIKLRIPIGVHFSEASIRMMTMRPVTLPHMEDVDPEVYATFNVIANTNSDEEIQAMSLDGFRSPAGEEIFPGSAALKVTRATRDIYVDMAATKHLRTVAGSAMQMLAGIINVLHSNNIKEAFIALSRMTTHEFNQLVGGNGVMTEIRASAWRANTIIEVSGGNTFLLGSVDMFFAMVEGMTHEGRCRLLRFWTGMHCLPKGGFEGMTSKMRLVFDTDAPRGRLPTAHTCVMSMVMPCCADLVAMRAMFSTALASMTMEDN